MSRVKNITRNMLYGYGSQIIIALFTFISRSIFIKHLGIEYLGISGLFTNVLGVLALVELGVGPAMTFTLYKPVADNDTERIKSIMQLYKKMYMYIALIITVIGLAIVPFIDKIVKTESVFPLLRVYYFLFLAGTVATYFSAYKRSLLIAYQRQYIATKIDTIFMVALNIAIIVVLILFKNYLIYLIVLTIIKILQNIVMNIYINKEYPYLTDGKAEPLSKDYITELTQKVKGLFLHKIAYAVINQTDYIIISTFVNITSVGLVTNYNLLIQTIKSVFSTTISSILGSLGNFVTIENTENKFKAYQIYSLLMFWLYGVVTIGFFSLADSFIFLWLGDGFTIDNFTWLIIMLNFFLYGNLAALWEIKMVSGIFVKDKWVDAIAAAVNIAVSLILVKPLGMLGVFIGTLANTAVVYILRPRIIYRYAFNKNIVPFYYQVLLRLICVVAGAAVSILFRELTLKTVTIPLFILNTLVTFIVANGIFYVVYRKTEAYAYLEARLASLLKKIKKS